jgi:hypothetical protein
MVNSSAEERTKGKIPPAHLGKKETFFCKYNPILVKTTSLPLFIFIVIFAKGI